MITIAVVLAVALKLPVVDVAPVRDACEKSYPARIVSVAEVNVRPQVSGEILEVGFRNGQSVKKGDVLYRLDPVQYEAAAKTAEAKVLELRSTLEYATLTSARYEELVKTRAVSQDELDKARSVRDSSRASLAAAEASLIAARDDLRHCTIQAPISGRIGTTTLTEGNYVLKGEGCLVTLVQTDPIRVRLQMSNADYRTYFGAGVESIRRDGRVTVRTASVGGTVVTGRVEYVENRSDASSDTVGVYALLENADEALLSGQTVMATIANVNGVMRPAVPPNAIAQDLQGAYVWVVGAGGKAAKRRVARGARAGGLQLVKSGLAVGERIVADGVHRVREGSEVEAE